jgi:hypothetical protein
MDDVAARRGFAGRFVDAGMYLSRGLLRMRQPWRTWIVFLVTVNVVVPLVIFPSRHEARLKRQGRSNWNLARAESGTR